MSKNYEVKSIKIKINNGIDLSDALEDAKTLCTKANAKEVEFMFNNVFMRVHQDTDLNEYYSNVLRDLVLRNHLDKQSELVNEPAIINRPIIDEDELLQQEQKEDEIIDKAKRGQ